ncbi:MAG: hypothetical protein AMS23_02585, partial [Bacteroides sp. SM1_62]
MKKRLIRHLSIFLLAALPVLQLVAQEENNNRSILRSVPIEHYNFSKKDKDAHIWSAMYIATNNKIYIGLCTHGDAANVYEFDIESRTMKSLANLTILLDERGKGIWTNGKIHVRLQELDGYVYFGSFCEDNGPPAIDAGSYRGPFWFRINMETGEVETLSIINSFWGLLGQVMDKERRIIYGLTEHGHLCRYFIDEDYTEDMGRVDNWDICRTLLMDDAGNVYGSYPPARIWKYDVEKDRIFNLEHLRLPATLDSRTMANPMLDRRAQWRYIEWDPVDRVGYGIIGGNNMLFAYDVDKKPEGEVRPLALMCAPMYRDGNPFDIPHATLAMTINQINRKIYYIPVISGDFDYGIVNLNIESDRQGSHTSGREMPPLSYMVSYDLETGEREEIGMLKTPDGRYAFGMGAAETDKEGRIW